MRAFTNLVIAVTVAHLSIAAVAQKHPHFDDKGTLQWHTSFDAAKAAAKAGSKIVFVQYGREACGNCRALTEGVLPSEAIKARMSALAIGVAADCDAPDDALANTLREKLPEAQMLPFVGFFTSDGTWIEGYSGYKDPNAFLQVLARVEKSPLLDATPAVRKQLEKHAAGASAAAEKSDWPAVLLAAREAGKSNGRCPERDIIKSAEKKARDWAAAELDAVAQQAKTSSDVAALRKQLGVVKQKFASEPEAADAETGLKALQKLVFVREVEATGKPARDLRERHAAPFKGTRWTAVFDQPASGETK